MRYRPLEVILIGFILIFFLLAPVSQIACAQNGPPIVAIRVEGNTNINSHLILSAVSISLKETFNQEKIKSNS